MALRKVIDPLPFSGHGNQRSSTSMPKFLIQKIGGGDWSGKRFIRRGIRGIASNHHTNTNKSIIYTKQHLIHTK